jgi:hypothetical protein
VPPAFEAEDLDKSAQRVRARVHEAYVAIGRGADADRALAGIGDFRMGGESRPGADETAGPGRFLSKARKAVAVSFRPLRRGREKGDSTSEQGS